jgi:hypothetical protein
MLPANNLDRLSLPEKCRGVSRGVRNSPNRPRIRPTGIQPWRAWIAIARPKWFSMIFAAFVLARVCT